MTTLRLTSASTAHRVQEACAYRITQALAFARPQRPPAIPAEIANRLRPGTMERFRALPAADQRHLLAVAQSLHAEGAGTDLWLAGLLHDIGKCHRGRHVRLLDRGLWVIVRRIDPIARRIRHRATMPRGWSGLWIAAHHAELGSAMLQELGYAERICALVARHEDDTLAAQDRDLARLRAVDEARHSVPDQAGAIASTWDRVHDRGC